MGLEYRVRAPILWGDSPEIGINVALTLFDFDLRRDDNDSGALYGGLIRTPADDGILLLPQLIADLQQWLLDHGFLVIPFDPASGQVNAHSKGKFDVFTEWAVREFQIHAKLPQLKKSDNVTAV